MGFLTAAELAATGATFGRDVLVSVDARLFGADRITFGDNVRVDAFCVLSAGGGEIHIGDHVHIASGVRLFGGGGLSVGDFAGISAGSTVLTASDDFGGDWLAGPTIGAEYTNVTAALVRLERFALIGAHCVVLPGVTFGEGATLGAMSLASRSLDPWTIYGGVPARVLRPRSRAMVAKGDEWRRAYLGEIDATASADASPLTG